MMVTKRQSPTEMAQDAPLDHLLLVDDDQTIVQVLEQALRFKGYATRTCTSGREALETFSTHGPFDLVLTDLIMPDLTGIELLEQIKINDPSCEVLVLTGYGSIEKAVEALKKGAYDYLRKPTNLEELTISVAQALEHKRLTLENLHYQTDLKRLVEERSSELVQTKNFLHSVLESSTEYFIIATDPEGQIKLFNSGAEKLFGYRRGEVENKRSIIFLTDLEKVDDPNQVNDLLAGVLANEQHLVMTRDGKEITISLLVSPIRLEDGSYSGYIWMGRDVTEQLRLQEKLKEYTQNLEKKVTERTRELCTRNVELEETLQQLQSAQMQLLQSEKMASIGQLAAGVAHEINNPIGYINSNLVTLKKYTDNLQRYIHAVDRIFDGYQPEVIEELRTAKKSTKINFILDDVAAVVSESLEGINRVKTIIQDLKSFSHQGRSTVEEYDLNHGLRSTLNIVWNELKYKAVVEQNLQDLPLVRCYPQQINQVFMNLLVNAAQAIPDKGKINVSSYLSDAEVIIEISDTGAGISPEHRSKIFEPFFTTKDVGKGTGLGLSLSYSIVKKHGGSIELESEVGVGTTFRVRLPVAGPPSEEAATSADVPREKPPKKLLKSVA